MSELSELEGRLTAAMERIGRGMETLQEARSADPDELAQLRAALEDERLVSAQLEERVKTLHARQASEIEELQARADKQRGAIQTLDARLQRLRKANQQMREVNQALREAKESEGADPHLINKSMLAELEALRATQEADRAEADLILAAMRPLLAEDSAGDSTDTVTEGA
ncbi:hypothetical protein SAMN04490248_103163 [Salinihabitans flavidus]|uniref:Uncharacterized protein n=1 Tax=Salinihabitans flavidus TaxID=569882 RepID=A0A1H8NGQ3_9RHOB|nr:hypothetical protein [Salinihabitans flavidus]SEO28573.1 hypothetical protein SAMN04490248_103163 [Salinihabitans flavidus]